jgi:pimeloyl-ACP methyl ester carboxylesterase
MPDQRTISLAPDVQLPLEDTGRGRPVLLLHGGGGPGTVASIGAHLSAHARVLLPTHPGWNGMPRPERLATVADLAALYLDLLRLEQLEGVVLIGSSVGGWVAADMATTSPEGRISGLVLIDSAGVQVEGEPMPDFFALDARGIAEHSYYDADRFYVDPATLPPERAAMMQSNMATLRAVAGEPYMYDPTLMGRLANITVPSLVIWGDSDRIFTPGYGRAMAAAIPAARYELVPKAGHLPHLEQPDFVFRLLDSFLG